MARLDALGPVAAGIVVAVEAGHTDADGVLGAGYVALVLGVVLEAEEQTGEHLLVVVGELVGPDLAGGVAGGGGHSAALHEFLGGLDGDGERPAGGVLRDVGLVDPGAGEVDAVREVGSDALAERGGGPGLEAGVGGALKLDVFDAALAAELTLEVGAAVGVDDEDVGAHAVEGLEEVEHSAAGVDVGVLDVADGLDHVEPLALRVDGAAVLERGYGGVGPDADVEVAVAGGLLEEGHVARVEHIVAPGHEHFPGFRHISDAISRFLSRGIRRGWCAPARRHARRLPWPRRRRP